MRASELHADFRLRNGRTVLADARFTPPLKLAKPFPVEGCSRAIHVTVMDASPGMLDGDRYELSWTVGDGSSVAATTQSYAKVHPCPRAGVVQKTRIAVGEGASFVHAPQPMLLYADASFKGSTRVELAAGASLLLLDTLGAGRIHHAGGEAFRYRLYEHELIVAIQGKIALASRVRFAPGEQSLSSPGVFENDTHVGSLYGFGPFVNRAAVGATLSAAEENRNVRAGASLLAHSGLAAIVLGSSAWDVQQTLLAMGCAIADFAREHAPQGCAPFAWPSWQRSG